MQDFKNFLIGQKQTITEAFSLIDKNTMGLVFVVDDKDQVIGLATDGDIRRWLIKNQDMEAPIAKCMNTKFVSVSENTPREQILKMLDHKIHVIPVLSAQKKLVDIFSRWSFPIRGEKRIVARAKAPVRISFGGGGTDLTHYFVENGGAVMNATINMYAHATLKKRDDDRIRIYSHDLRKKIEGGSVAELIEKNKDFSLILSLIKLLDPQFGLDLQIASDFPMGSGLGGSAVVSAAIIGCFNQFREDRWDNYEMAELAFQAERLTLNVAGGWQDQYATVFGGFNFMEFTKGSNVVHPLRIPADLLSELEESLVLCYAGGSHQSGDIHKDQKQEMQKDDIRNLVAQNKELTYQMKTYLLRGQLCNFAKALDQAWMMKRQFSPKISTSNLDQIYDMAKANGAMGGKLLGAGGGGYFLFFINPDRRFEFEKAFENQKLELQRVTFEDKGLQAWTVREDSYAEA